MVDTYWDKADRGAVAAPAGYRGYVNTLAGQAPGASRYVPGGGVGLGGGVYGRTPSPSPTATYAKRAGVLQNEANTANENRYNEGRRLLGLEDPNAWQKLGFASPDAYEAHKARTAGESAAPATMGGGAGFGTGGINPAGVAAQGGNITPQALASRVQAMQRGIYNSSTALNREAVTNSLALNDAARANQSQAMQQAQLNESIRRGQAAEASDLRNQQLQWIYNRNDQGPNLDRLQQIAAAEGQGNTEGMGYPSAQGGGGGQGPQQGQQGMTPEQRAAQRQYNAYMKQQQEQYAADQAKKAGLRRQSYDTSRNLKRAASTYAAPPPASLNPYGSNLWQRATQGIIPRGVPVPYRMPGDVPAVASVNPVYPYSR